MQPYSRHHAALGRAIRELRNNRLGISQEALADRCGLDRTYVSGIERGERNLSFAKILQLADGLGVRLGELVAEYERQLGG